MFIRVYVNLPDIGDINESDIDLSVGERSFDLKIKNYKGKSMRLVLNNLASKINSAESKFILKKNYVIVKLVKASPQMWGNIHYEKKFNPTAKMDPKEDPQVGLMNMMQRMYQEGDDEMKRTIQEAFVKANEEKNKK